LAVYTGGTVDDPSTATLLWDAGTVNPNGTAGVYTITHPSGGVTWPKNTATWLAWKRNTGVNVYYSDSSADAGDFQTVRGRNNNSFDQTPTVAFPSTYGQTGTFSDFWYSIYVTHEVSTAPDQVTGLSATAVSNRIDLAWTAPSDGGDPITGYKIERRIGAGAWAPLVADTGTTATTYSDTTVFPGTQYGYRVSAINGVGAGPVSIEATATANNVPAPVTGLSATAVGSQIDLAWTAPSDGGDPITGYIIERRGCAGSWSTLVVTTGTTYSDTTVAPSTCYGYRVSAMNTVGTGSASTEATATSNAGGTGSILLVTPDAASLTAQDAAKKALIESWGYTVVPISASDTQANFDAAVATASAAYVSEEITSSNLGTKLRGATIGVVNAESALENEFGFSSDYTTFTDSAIDITDNTHYITSPFSTGSLTITSSAQPFHYVSGTIASGLQVLAEQPATTNGTLVAIDTGGALFDSGTAAGRRVYLPWGGNAFDINSLNANGQLLMRKAIEWATTGAGGAGAASELTSIITASPTSIDADGTSTSTITVILKDAGGNFLATGGDTVTLATTLGSLSAVTDNGNGTYTATLTSSTTAGTATLTGTVNAAAIADDATVEFVGCIGNSFCWDGGGSTNNWSEAANWWGDTVPGSGDAVLFNDTSTKDAIIDISVFITGWTITAGYTGTITAQANLTNNGDFTQNGGTLDLGATTMTHKGDWTYTAGTVNAGTSTVTFDNGTQDQTVNAGSMAFNNVTIAKDTTNLTGTIDVNGNLTLTSVANIGTIAVAGNVTTTDTSVSGSGTILLDGNDAQTLGGTGELPNVTINKPAGTLTIQGTIEVTGNWTYTAGTVNAGTSTVIFDNGTQGQTVNAGSMAFNNVTIDKSTTDLTVSGTMDVNGNLTITSVNAINTGTIAVAKNVTSTDTEVAGTATFLFDGTGAQTLGASGGTGELPNVTINKASGTLTIQDTIEISGDWTHTAGTVDAGTSMVAFTNVNQGQTVSAGAMSFNNLTIGKGTTTLTANGTMGLNGNLTITSGILDQNGYDLTVTDIFLAADTTWINHSGVESTTTLAGDVSNNGTIDLDFSAGGCGDADKIKIRSSAAGTLRAWSGSGIFSMIDVDVQDQAGTAAITVFDGKNSLNNGGNWIFVSCGSSTQNIIIDWREVY
jgi:hypothetical protein